MVRFLTIGINHTKERRRLLSHPLQKQVVWIHRLFYKSRNIWRNVYKNGSLNLIFMYSVVKIDIFAPLRTHQCDKKAEMKKKERIGAHSLLLFKLHIAEAIWEISSIDNFNEFHVQSVAFASSFSAYCLFGSG